MFDTGHVDPWWDDSYKSLPYDIPDLRLDDPTKTEEWDKQGFSVFKYGGGIYNMTQSMPVYAEPFMSVFDWKNTAIQFFILKPMWAVPPHCDGYPGYAKRNNITNLNQIRRGVVFLEDWKSGHYLEVDGQPFIKWKAGDWVWWQGATPHYAANIGLENRYTLQITGVIHEF